MSKKNKGGRPRLFKTPEEMQVAIDNYFESGEPIGISRLAYALGFESRQSLYDYEKSEQFSYTIKRAKLRVEMYYEDGLNGTSPTGSIFALKNMGWSDKQEINTTIQGGEEPIKVKWQK
jgi:hypothetical protein